MSADVLREAAKLMREDYADTDLGDHEGPDPVMYAVADWLDFMAEAYEDGYLKGDHSLAVARAYLGTTP